MSDLFEDLSYRGIIKNATSESIKSVLNGKPITLYCGFDPSSDSLHVGSLLPLVTLKRFENAGHNCIAVVGGATGMIGDPSGKSAERNLLTPDVISANLVGIKSVISKFINGKVMNNGDWFQNFSYIDFLRDIGKHFTVNIMLTKESVRARLEDRDHGISYTEFSYMLLQAYDFYFLNKNHGCEMQIGGSDQWGNITAGCELIRRMSANENPDQINNPPEVHGLTHPLVAKSDGTKFGKSESGTVWLTPEKTSPYDFYQFWIRVADSDAIPYLKYFTFLSHSEIDALEQETKLRPESRLAQKKLAEEITSMVHGKSELDKVIQTSEALFTGDFSTMSAAQIKSAYAQAPQSTFSKSSIKSGLPLADVLADTKLCNSKGAARKDIKGGGIYLNQERVQDPALTLSPKDLIEDQVLLLRKGKKNFHLVVFE